MDFLNSFAGALKFGVANMAWIFIVLWGIERLWPKDRPSERVQLASLRFWAFYAIAGAAIVSGFELVKPSLNLEPLVVIRAWKYLPLWAAYILSPIASMALYDFFNYWMHRAQHKWFWKQHSVHHSIRHLSAVNSYMHWTEEAFRLAFISIPTAIAFDLRIGGATLATAMLTMMHGNFIHSASSLHFGKYGRLLFADNRWHRIHHSVEPEHFDKNFATAVPLWDWLFGTAHYTKSSDWPQTGVHDQPEVSTVSEYLWRPFRGVRPRQVGIEPARQ